MNRLYPYSWDDCLSSMIGNLAAERSSGMGHTVLIAPTEAYDVKMTGLRATSKLLARLSPGLIGRCNSSTWGRGRLQLGRISIM